MSKFSEYLNESYSVNNLKTEITRLTQALALKTGNPKKQVILNGLIGVMLGVYSLNDKRITELTKEYIEQCMDLL
ncbi:hypothetical protein FACS1894206_09340 [Deltaproteobacteria bacterium]|nr:hypothetical protein FACS1894206_09340 [Deltaproteobacteria bacterium]